MAILAVANPVYQQAMRVITAITNAYPALVTTSFANQFQTGMKVRINIPLGYGMQQLNQQLGQITVINDTQFTINLDTTSFDAFAVPAAYFPIINPKTQVQTLVVPEFAQVVPVGEDVHMITAAWRNVLNGNPNGAVST